MMVTISVVTICFNNLEELLVTAGSVDQQTIKPYEHWIIDGSTDGNIKNYLDTHDQPAYRKWICEPDKGIADAFNKGVLKARGEIINMLNSADYYHDEFVLENVADAFNQDPQLMWLHGKYMLQRGGLWVTIGKPFDPGKLYRGMRSVSHQSMFIKRILHEKYGLYDTSLKNAMDYDFICRISKEPFLFINKPLVVFAPGGTTDKHYLYALEEGRKVFERYKGPSIKLRLWQWRLKILFYILKSRLGRVLYKLKTWLRLENL